MHPIANALPDCPLLPRRRATRRLRDAKVSVLDRGFIFGDGVYEVVPAYGGPPFRFDEHMARLDRSLAELRIANPMRPHSGASWSMRLIAAYAHARTSSAGHDQRHLHPGDARRGDARPCDAAGPDAHRVRDGQPHDTASPSGARRGRRLRDARDDFRWQKAHIKTTSLAGAVLARQISVDVGAAETIMFRDELAQRGLLQQRLGGQGRHRHAARPRTTWCWKASATA